VSVKVTCSNCSARFRVDDEAAAVRAVLCPACRKARRRKLWFYAACLLFVVWMGWKTAYNMNQDAERQYERMRRYENEAKQAASMLHD
jgi:predicted Zn finger-like uncharacterized protein